MSKEDKSRVRRRDDQLPSAPRGAQPGPASHQASAPHLLPRNDAIALAQWSAAIIAAAAALWLSRGTSFAPIGDWRSRQPDLHMYRIVCGGNRFALCRCGAIWPQARRRSRGALKRSHSRRPLSARRRFGQMRRMATLPDPRTGGRDNQTRPLRPEMNARASARHIPALLLQIRAVGHTSAKTLR